MNAYGRDDLMAVAAFRYSLGRMTYIVSDCAHWLCEQWPNIAENAREVIQRDVNAAKNILGRGRAPLAVGIPGL